MVKTKRFENKIAIVTGAASGIGYAITENLINEGASVVGADLNENSLNDLEKKFGKQFIGMKTDVTNENDHKTLILKVIDNFGKLDYAFNVAGGLKPGVITDLSFEDWKFTIDLVLNGVFLGMKHQGHQMEKQDSGGAIVNISSLNAHLPMYSGSAYASAKAGVEMLTKNGALEMARNNIRVNAILPGLVKTPLSADFTASKEKNEAFMDRIPMKRAAEPNELAKPALFLISDDASYINGVSLVVDGAWETSGYPDLSQF